MPLAAWRSRPVSAKPQAARGQNKTAAMRVSPRRLMECSIGLLLRRQDLRHIGDDLFDSRGVQLALLEGVVGDDLLLDVKHHRNLGVLGYVVLLGAGGSFHRGEDAVLDPFLRAEFFQLVVELLVGGEKHDEAAHLLVLVLAGFGINLFYQTGQVVADFASEDHRDRVAAVLSDKAQALARVLAGHVQDVEGPAEGLPRLGARLERVARDADGNRQRSHGNDAHRNAMSHRKTYLLLRWNPPYRTFGKILIVHDAIISIEPGASIGVPVIA